MVRLFTLAIVAVLGLAVVQEAKAQVVVGGRNSFVVVGGNSVVGSNFFGRNALVVNNGVGHQALVGNRALIVNNVGNQALVGNRALIINNAANNGYNVGNRALVISNAALLNATDVGGCATPAVITGNNQFLAIGGVNNHAFVVQPSFGVSNGFNNRRLIVIR
jgi:carbonic anhydrase/acetyltransferase-like protein (isoleucine patch superfamily)